MAIENDPRFLADFIFANYLGPDVLLDTPRRSASQRVAENLPPYNLSDLGSEFLNLSQLENLYYYLMRKANQNLIWKLRPLENYFQGKLPEAGSVSSEKFQQFLCYFPLSLHDQSKHGEHQRIFNRMVVVDDPDTKYMNADDVKKFKIFTGLDGIKIDKDLALGYFHGYRHSVGNDDKPSNVKRKRSRASIDVSPNEVTPTLTSLKETALAVKPLNMRPPADFDGSSEVLNRVSGNELNGHDQSVRPSSMSGSSPIASTERTGQPIGIPEIGASKKAYFFRVWLPGIKKDKLGQFSCNVKHDGRVYLKGENSMSEDLVIEHAGGYEMKSRNYGRPGPFEYAFRLPGPVDPRLFEAKLRDDGYFQAMVMKFILRPANKIGTGLTYQSCASPVNATNLFDADLANHMDTA